MPPYIAILLSSTAAIAALVIAHPAAAQTALVYRPGTTATIDQGNVLKCLVFFTRSADEVDANAENIAPASYATGIVPSTGEIPRGGTTGTRI